jgi:20S proteasome alpha/beta subunit
MQHRFRIGTPGDISTSDWTTAGAHVDAAVYVLFRAIREKGGTLEDAKELVRVHLTDTIDRDATEDNGALDLSLLRLVGCEVQS